MNEVSARQLAGWLDDTLQTARFKDYCPNGLQVEGRPAIRRIVTGVTVSQALLEHAVACGADAVLAHHGWFWKNEDPRVRGPKRRRLALALAHELNIFAYHLPLDAHPELGNNAQLARVLGLSPDRDAEGAPLTCGPGDLVWLGTCPGIDTLEDLEASVCKHLQRAPLVVGDLQQKVKRVAWCTGGAQSMMDAAIEAGADVYITGEVSEPTYHLAIETGTGFIGAGHHATERYGIQALGQAVARQFGIEVEFVDMDNPV